MLKKNKFEKGFNVASFIPSDYLTNSKQKTDDGLGDITMVVIVN
jgi:hypothetical protein